MKVAAATFPASTVLSLHPAREAVVAEDSLNQTDAFRPAARRLSDAAHRSVGDEAAAVPCRAVSPLASFAKQSDSPRARAETGGRPRRQAATPARPGGGGDAAIPRRDRGGEMC